MSVRIGAFVSVLAFVGIAIVAGCSSTTDAAGAAAGGDCPAVGSKVCDKEAAITQADVDDCNKSKNDATCGSKYVDFLKCAGSNVKCKADGTTDSAALLAACKTQFQAYSDCTTPAQDAGTD